MSALLSMTPRVAIHVFFAATFGALYSFGSGRPNPVVFYPAGPFDCSSHIFAFLLLAAEAGLPVRPELLAIAKAAAMHTADDLYRAAGSPSGAATPATPIGVIGWWGTRAKDGKPAHASHVGYLLVPPGNGNRSAPRSGTWGSAFGGPSDHGQNPSACVSAHDGDGVGSEFLGWSPWWP